MDLQQEHFRRFHYPFYTMPQQHGSKQLSFENFVLFLLIVVCIILLMVFISVDTKDNKKMRIKHKIPLKEFTEFFLVTMRTANQFTEGEVERNINAFRFNRTLFGSRSGDGGNDNWETNVSDFLEVCFISLNMLSHYVDEQSVYHKDEQIWKILGFTSRLLCVKMRHNNLDFYTCDEVYYVLATLVVAMHVIQGDNFAKDEYLKFYSARFVSPYALDDCDAALPIDYRDDIAYCRNFIQSIKL